MGSSLGSMASTAPPLVFRSKSIKPAEPIMATRSSFSAAPATHPTRASTLCLTSSGRGRSRTMSEMETRPPGFRTRAISFQTAGWSGLRLRTQLERTTSMEASGSGMASIWPWWNSTLASPVRSLNCRAFRLALASISSVMSTPWTLPVGPTRWAARKASRPAPLPRSRTTSPAFRPARAVGLPQERPRLAPSGRVANSAAE